MGKPLIHMIPSQETRLRNSLTETSNTERLPHNRTSATEPSTKNEILVVVPLRSKQPSTIADNGVNRSSTNVSNISDKSFQRNSSNESSGLSSFVHSNASISSSPSTDFTSHRNNDMSTVLVSLPNEGSSSHVMDSTPVATNKNALVPESITTSRRTSSSKVRIAVQNYEESIEITRQRSPASPAVSSSSGMKRLTTSLTRLNKTPKNDNKKARKVTISVKSSSFVGSALTSNGRSMSRSNGIKIQNSEEDNGTMNAFNPEAPKCGDESTITSAPSDCSSLFGSSYRSISKEDDIAIPRFEVLLDEIPEATSQEESREKPTQELPNFSVINPRLFVTQRKSRSTKSPRKRQQSFTARSVVTTTTTSAASTSFFSAIDKHVAIRRSNTLRKRTNVSIEVLPSPKVEEDVVVVNTTPLSSDTNNLNEADTATNLDLSYVLSPSKIKAVRQHPSTTTAASFQMPPLPTSISFQKQKKKIYTISEGRLVVNEADECEQQGAIEVKATGSVIIEQKLQQPRGQQEEENGVSSTSSTLEAQKEETVKKPYQLVRLAESNTELLKKSRSKTPSKSLLAKGLRIINRRQKDSSSSQNPIQVISDDENTDAVELLRTISNVGLSSTFSYEDTIVKRVSPPPSPFPPVQDLQIVGGNEDIEVVVPSSRQGTKFCTHVLPLATDASMGKIVSIRKLCIEDEHVEASSSTAPIKIVSPVRNSQSTETSAPPKKIDPVVETPSNRVEDSVIDVTRANSCSSQSPSSISSISPTKSSSTLNVHQTNISVEKEAKAPKNGDQLVFIDREQSIPKIAKKKVVPKIPAPKKDTTSKNLKSSHTAPIEGLSSIESSKNVKVQVNAAQLAEDNAKNIGISSVSTQELTVPVKKVSSLVQKYSSIFAKKSLPIQELKREKSFKSNYIAHVTILGVAGIVVDRKKCRDVTGNISSPSPPDQMTAVIGISETGEESIDNVTTLSSTLVHAPHTKVKNVENAPKPENDAQRHIAVWASNYKGESPGSIVESKMFNLNTTDKNELSSEQAPKFLDLNVALAESDEGIHHAAVVIGSARIEITDEMMSGNSNRCIDLPVQKVVKEGPSPSSDKNRVLLLKTASQQGEVRKLCIEKVSNQEVNENEDGLTSAYTIDPVGDSMIRIQIRVEKVDATSKGEEFKTTGSFTNQTAATERSDESSIKSGASPKQPESKELYSEPLFVNGDATCNSLSTKDELLATNEATNGTDLPGCQVFGTGMDLPSCNSKANKGLASQIDDRIEDMANHVFSNSYPAPKRDDSSLDRDNDTATTTNHTYYTGATKRKLKLLDEVIPTLKELRSLAKEFALSGGEFFSENACTSNNKDDVFSVGSSALVTTEEEECRDFDSWKKKRDGDDITYSSVGSDCESLETEVSFLVDEAPCSQNDDLFNLDENKFNFHEKRRVNSENNKFDLTSISDRSNDVRVSRTFKSYPGEAAQLDVGCEGDDEESFLKNRAALFDDVVDEENSDKNLRRQSSGRSGKPSLPSVVENIAEVLSIGGKACGYFSVDKVDSGAATHIAIWNAHAVKEIPKTVDESDLQSVGELTAITLEKDEIKEINRKLLLKRLGLPNELLAWGGRAKANAGDGTDAEESDGQNLGEDYFADYEEESSKLPSIYGISEAPEEKDGVTEETDVEEEPEVENSSIKSHESNPEP